MSDFSPKSMTDLSPKSTTTGYGSLNTSAETAGHDTSSETVKGTDEVGVNAYGEPIYTLEQLMKVLANEHQINLSEKTKGWFEDHDATNEDDPALFLGFQPAYYEAYRLSHGGTSGILGNEMFYEPAKYLEMEKEIAKAFENCEGAHVVDSTTINFDTYDHLDKARATMKEAVPWAFYSPKYGDIFDHKAGKLVNIQKDPTITTTLVKYYYGGEKTKHGPNAGKDYFMFDEKRPQFFNSDV